MACESIRAEDGGVPRQCRVERVLTYLEEAIASRDAVRTGEQGEHEPESPELGAVLEAEAHPVEAPAEPRAQVTTITAFDVVLALAPLRVGVLEDSREQGVLVLEVPVDRRRG